MKVGDMVMFTDEGRYAKWFYGQLAEIIHYSPVGSDGKAHCRVRWLQPVEYFGRYAQISDFSVDKFEGIKNEPNLEVAK